MSEATASPALPLAMAKVIGLDRGEFAPFCDGLRLPAGSALSPLTGLRAERGVNPPRSFDELRAQLGAVAEPVAAHYLGPMLFPDRILDARATVYEGAPTPCRLFSSRRQPGTWAALRTAMERSYEIVVPYSDEDLAFWLDLQMALSARNLVGSPWEELTGEQLAFLLALFDAHATAMHRSFLDRRWMPRPTTVHYSDIIEAQNDALRVRDRRFLLTAVGEIFEVLMHAGGRQGIGLPPVTAELAEREVRRYVANHWMSVVEKGPNPVLRLEPAIAVPAFTLLSWLTIVSLHDIQVVGHDGQRTLAEEDATLFIIAEPAVWVLASEGMTDAVETLADVRFRLQTVTALTGSDVLRNVLVPLDTGALPDAVYAAASAAPAPVRQQPPPPTPDPAPTASPPIPAPPWRPAHAVPPGGMPAWDAPEATRQPVAHLDPWLQVQLLERRPEGWGRIMCENGWEGWVDWRVLQEVQG